MPFRVGLIGLHGHQGALLEGCKQLDDCEFVAICCDEEDKLEAFGKSDLGQRSNAYTDYREMLAKENLDICGVCNINNARTQMLIDLAEAGIHILSEKPLVTTLDDLAKVKEAIGRSEAKLSMLLTMRFTASYKLVHDLIADGVIGDVVLATVQKSYKLGDRPEWMRSRETFGGTIPFVGIHALDLVRWCTGQDFVEGMAYHSNAGHPDIRDMEDNASVVVKLANGGTGSARIDYCRPAAAPTHGDDRIRVAGTKGVVEVTEAGSKVVLMTADEEPREVPLPEEEMFFADFVASIKGECEHRISPADAFRMTEICLKLRDAADEGHVVKL